MVADILLPPADLVVLARTGGTYGVKGWLRLVPMGDDASLWCSISEWWINRNDKIQLLKTATDQWQVHECVGFRISGRQIIIKFENIDSATQAQEWTSRLLAVSRTKLPKLNDDEYYWADLIGLTVKNHSGQLLGTVTKLHDTSVHAVLEVESRIEAEKNSIGQYLIPFVASYVLSVDIDNAMIIVAWQKDWW